MSKGIVPGVYEQKDATSIVRKMQEEAITTFEAMVSQFDKYSLHFLHYRFMQANYLPTRLIGIVINYVLTLMKP